MWMESWSYEDDLNSSPLNSVFLENSVTIADQVPICIGRGSFLIKCTLKNEIELCIILLPYQKDHATAEIVFVRES